MSESSKNYIIKNWKNLWGGVIAVVLVVGGLYVYSKLDRKEKQLEERRSKELLNLYNDTVASVNKELKKLKIIAKSYQTQVGIENLFEDHIKKFKTKASDKGLDESAIDKCVIGLGEIERMISRLIIKDETDLRSERDNHKGNGFYHNRGNSMVNYRGKQNQLRGYSSSGISEVASNTIAEADESFDEVKDEVNDEAVDEVNDEAVDEANNRSNFRYPILQKFIEMYEKTANKLEQIKLSLYKDGDDFIIRIRVTWTKLFIYYIEFKGNSIDKKPEIRIWYICNISEQNIPNGQQVINQDDKEDSNLAQNVDVENPEDESGNNGMNEDNDEVNLNFMSVYL